MPDFEHSPLDNAVVELTAPDGRAFQFRYVTIIEHEAQDYVVLMELETDVSGQEQMLITRLLEDEAGELTFAVVEEEDIIEAVFEKYVGQSLQNAMEMEPLDNEEEDCGCGHSHEHPSGRPHLH